MTTLTDTQLVLLSRAAQRPDLLVAVPERLKGQAARNALQRLITRALVEEVAAQGAQPVWRRDEEGSYALRITKEGLAAIGIEPEETPTDDPEDDAASALNSEPRESNQLPPAEAHPCSGSKQALIVGLLSREEGATLADITAATGWLPHTAHRLAPEGACPHQPQGPGPCPPVPYYGSSPRQHRAGGGVIPMTTRRYRHSSVRARRMIRAPVGRQQA